MCARACVCRHKQHRLVLCEKTLFVAQKTFSSIMSKFLGFLLNLYPWSKCTLETSLFFILSICKRIVCFSQSVLTLLRLFTE